MKEKEEELALFRELQKREKETDDARIEDKPCRSLVNEIVLSEPVRKNRADDLLNSENDKSDYDWLLTPPKTPDFPSLEMEPGKTLMGQIMNTNARPIALNSRQANPHLEVASKGIVASRQKAVSGNLSSSSGGNRRSSSSGRAASTGSRPATPTTRPSLCSSARTSRPSTPTSRTTYPSAKTTASVIYSTPTRSLARPSTPNSRNSNPLSKPTSRSATPTRRASTPSSVSKTATLPRRSSSDTKLGTSKTRVPSCGTSLTVRSRPWNPAEMPGFSLEAPPNLRTLLPVRPASASRGRPTTSRAQSSSAKTSSSGMPRRQSCSPSRGWAQPGNSYGINRVHSNGKDIVSPVVMGTKVAERVVSMRKPASPKQADNRSSLKSSFGKSLSFPDSSGFGRMLSGKSIDMALRHMDIRGSAPGNLRPLMTKVPLSSMYSVRSGQTISQTTSVSGSPLASSSNASSELSFNNNSLCLEGSEVEGSDLSSERGQLSPAVIHGR